jgi:ribulose-phosphate 3-epimerase
MIPVVPAVIPKNQTELELALTSLTFSPEVHIDVVDGQYVPFVSWPYEPTGDPMATKPQTDCYTLEVDLMVKKPLIAAASWIKAGADMLVFHTDNIDLESFKDFVANTHVTVSIATTPDFNLVDLAPYLEVANGVQLMGIAQVGAQGQPFARAVLDKIKEIKGAYPRLPITIDGSVNMDTIKELAQAGADRFICGSAILGSDDPEASYKKLWSLTNI